MKKRLFSALMAVLMIGNVLTGCGVHSDRGEGLAVMDDPVTDISPQYTLKTDDYIYVIDENGEKLSGFNRYDALEAIGDEIEDQYYFSFVTAFGNIAICKYAKYGADIIKYYAYNCNTGKVVNFYNTEKSPNSVEYYKGNVYVTFDDTELSFTIDEDLAAVENGPVMEDIFEILGDYVTVGFVNPTRLDASITGTLDETGYILVEPKGEVTDGIYYMVKADGSVTLLPQFKGEDINIAGYSREGIIYRTYKDWDFDGAYCLNVDTLEFSKLPWDKPKTSLGAAGGKLYSCDDSRTDVYMMDIHDYYAYDMASGEEEKLFSTEAVPGSGYGLGRYGDFKMCGDNAFVLDVVGDMIKWLRVDYKDGDVSFTDIDCPVKEVTPLKFGAVEYEGESYVCPKCGKLVGKSYQEYPVIDGGYSEHAEEINASLKELLTAQTAEDIFAPDDDHCDWHDYEEGLFDTHESLVWDMHIINNRFLTVEISTYTMAVGGAHGYGTDYQLVYDLQTGKNLKNRDIFKGSEEEFKTFIAQKTKEYAENSDEEERKRFYSSDPDDIYNSAYENASFENTNLQYYDDHLELVYLQYEMGAYASGVFYIDISYEDFIGANTLTIE